LTQRAQLEKAVPEIGQDPFKELNDALNFDDD
jgi:hypothetical protein